MLDIFSLRQPFPGDQQTGYLSPLGKRHAGFTGKMTADTARTDIHARSPLLDSLALSRIIQDFPGYVIEHLSLGQQQTPELLLTGMQFIEQHLQQSFLAGIQRLENASAPFLLPGHRPLQNHGHETGNGHRA